MIFEIGLSAIVGIILGFLIAWLVQQNRFSKQLETLKIEKVQLQKDIESDQERMKWLELTQEKLKETERHQRRISASDSKRI